MVDLNKKSLKVSLYIFFVKHITFVEISVSGSGPVCFPDSQSQSFVRIRILPSTSKIKDGKPYGSFHSFVTPLLLLQSQ